MNNNELSLDQHKQAVELHQKILISASLAQQNLWDMCSGLKQMRDGKLYKELGYANFEDYCENEVGMTRRNVYRYISVVENVQLENVTPVSQIGIKKLALLATLSSEQQEQVSEKVDLETTTYKELKAEIDKLKSENSELERKSRFDDAEKRSLQARLDDTGNAMRSAVNDKQKAEERAEQAVEEMKTQRAEMRQLKAERDSAVQQSETAKRQASQDSMTISMLEANKKLLENKIDELENRPIDVAVVDNREENERKLNEAIEKIRQENKKYETELEEKYRAESERTAQKLEEEKQTAISEIRNDYEKKLSESAAAEPVDKLKFKVYLTSAYDILGRLLVLASQHTEPIYKEKIKELLNNVLTNMEDPQLWRN